MTGFGGEKVRLHSEHFCSSSIFHTVTYVTKVVIVKRMIREILPVQLSPNKIIIPFNDKI
eukprot:snap_masked-scaffold_6-processed-gene-17.3-mRNA-1 protein AED:1.00 eAED:1.00 QI:0/-1/0/0/-1/1/1/0/59